MPLTSFSATVLIIVEVSAKYLLYGVIGCWTLHVGLRQFPQTVCSENKCQSVVLTYCIVSQIDSVRMCHLFVCE